MHGMKVDMYAQTRILGEGHLTAARAYYPK